jgi:hypothetical protein
MLTLDQLIAEATVLPDADKTILIEKLMESMAEQLEPRLELAKSYLRSAALQQIQRGAYRNISVIVLSFG